MAKREIGFVLAWVVLLATTPVAQAQICGNRCGLTHAALCRRCARSSSRWRPHAISSRRQQAEYQAITGARSMEQLLSGTARNYLPPDWACAAEHVAGGRRRAYPALAADLSRALKAESVLSAGQAGGAVTGSQCATAGGNAGPQPCLQSLTHEALANSSSRFAALQQLIDAIAPRRGIRRRSSICRHALAAETSMLQKRAHTTAAGALPRAPRPISGPNAPAAARAWPSPVTASSTAASSRNLAAQRAGA